ncbi:MAG: undecaprenyl-diphosphate phosphatase [Candidatus Omnitrophica bacterium]|nr:undecaprenyl-diphosphate phosphatase [Candidatus Omnitrophota bacterium]
MKTIALGITQGLTEFLPISSSGHLYIIKRLLSFSQNLLPFFVLLHLATLLAVVIFLRRDILSVLSKRRILIQLGITTLVTAIIGLAINTFLVGFFENKLWIGLLLIINGLILLSMKKVFGQRNYDTVTTKESLFIGLLQGLAIFPGISRSGITIVGLIGRGFKPKEAFTTSFLMMIPVTLGAFLLKMKELPDLNMSILAASGGFVAAFASGFLALKIVKKVLKSEKFAIFGYYCILVAILSIIV